MKKIFSTISLFLFSILVGCAPTAKVPVMKPAEINLGDIRKVAIGDIKGNTGKDFADIITSKLFESGKFDVLDRENINSLLEEHKLGMSGIVDESTAMQMGKVIGASALIAGKAESKKDIKRWKGDPWRDKSGYLHEPHKIKVTVQVTSILKVIDMTSGKILAVKTFEKEDHKTRRENDQWPAIPDVSEYEKNFANEIASEFLKMIAPYTIYVDVSFEKTKIPQGMAGIEYAKNGLWEEALEQFKLATEANQSDMASWHNLGVGYQYNYNFSKAIEAFKKCNILEPVGECIDNIGQVKQMETEQKKLEAQGALISRAID